MSDIRIKRTKLMVQQAFIHLVKQYGFEKITISQIAERSMISRQTFYAYYQDKYQLAEQMLLQFTDQFRYFLNQRLSL